MSASATDVTAAAALYSFGRRPRRPQHGRRRQPRPDARALDAGLLLRVQQDHAGERVRTVLGGRVRHQGPVTDAEQYTYSAVWLVFGVTLLVVGMLLRSQAVRLASAAVVILTVFKVFLIDMSDLTGIYQSLSFIGLGVVLLGVG